MGLKIALRYKRIKCVYFRTLNDALIFWITTEFNVEKQRKQQKIPASLLVSYGTNKLHG